MGKWDKRPGRWKPGKPPVFLVTVTDARTAQQPAHNQTFRLAQGADSYELPCIVSAFVVNSEPHTGARSSVRVCGGGLIT